MYVDSQALESGESAAFYSRRDNGPFYCWTLDKSSWSVARVKSSDSRVKELSLKSWKLIPAALRKRITEHYQD